MRNVLLAASVSLLVSCTQTAVMLSDKQEAWVWTTDTRLLYCKANSVAGGKTADPLCFIPAYVDPDVKKPLGK